MPFPLQWDIDSCKKVVSEWINDPILKKQNSIRVWEEMLRYLGDITSLHVYGKRAPQELAVCVGCRFDISFPVPGYIF